MSRGLRLLACIGVWLAGCLPATASHLVTGNGFGFAVIAPERGTATKFYPHPYSFVAPDPAKPLSEGIETSSFIKALGWGKPGPASVDYVDDSHVIRMARGGATATIFMPFGFDHPALVIALASAGRTPATWRVQWSRTLQSAAAVRAAGTTARLLRFDGIAEPLLLIPLTAINTPAGGSLAASPAWILVALEDARDAEPTLRDAVQWRAGLSPAQLAAREIAQFEQWRAKPFVHFASDRERHLWRQSETMLRIAQSREPNRADRHGNGLIVASLPDGVWFTPWVRDMAWATVAFARMGHRAEARAALLAYFNAQPTGKMRADVNGADYQVSVVRYFGNGAEEPFFTQEGSTNIEYDDWGEVLWALGEYLRAYRDTALLKTATYRGPLYESARDFIVKPLVANMEPHGGWLIMRPDTSIWEERQRDQKHFAFSTAMAIVGLRAFGAIAGLAGDDDAHRLAFETRQKLQRGFDAAFLRDGTLHGTLEDGVKNDIDGALLPIINFGVVRDQQVIRDTVARMELLKVVSGGYRRVRSTYTDPKIFEYWYERQEFLFVDLHLAELERKRGKAREADAMLARIVREAAADHNIIPEMYVALPCPLFPGRVGDPTGALPMVGYGAGAYILHLLEREKTSSAG